MNVLNSGWGGDNGILEFLYPPKALALLKRLSTYRLDRIAQTRRLLNRRTFSSHSKSLAEGSEAQLWSYEPETAPDIEEPDLRTIHLQEFNDFDWTLDPIEKKSRKNEVSMFEELQLNLGKIPAPGEDDAWNKPWDLYGQLLDPKIIGEFGQRLMVYLSFSSRELDKARLMELLAKIPMPESHNLWKATLISSCTGQLDRAMDFFQKSILHLSSWHEANPNKSLFDNPIIRPANEILLAHLIQKRQWKLAEEVYGDSIKMAPRFTQKVDAQRFLFDLWKVVGNLPDLEGHAMDYIENADISSGSLKSDFARQLISISLTHGTTPQRLTKLIHLLRFYGIETSRTYPPALEFLIDRFIRFHKHVTVSERIALHTLWSAYRIYCRPGQLKTPIVRDLLKVATAYYSTKAFANEERAFVLDILSVCSDDIAPLPYGTMIGVMGMYARRGNLEVVRLIESSLTPKLNAIQSWCRSVVDFDYDLQRLKALLQVHAVRGDLLGVQAAFDNIQSQIPLGNEYVMIWNRLILAYARLDELDKAFHIALVHMPSAGVSPNNHTFSNLLRACGWGGEASTMISLIDIAEHHKIRVDEWMIKNLILAYMKHHDGAIAEEIVEVLLNNNVNGETWSKYAFSSLLSDVLVLVAGRRDLRSANKIYNEMVQRKLPIGVVAYSALVELLTNIGETDQASVLVYSVMVERGFPVEDYNLSVLAKGYSVEHRYDGVLAVITELDRKGMPINARARAQHLNAFARLNRTNPNMDQKVILLLEKYLDERGDVTWPKDDHPVWFNHRTDFYFTVLIDAYCDIKATAMVETVMRMLWIYRRKAGLSLDFPIGILRVLMKVALAAGNYDMVKNYWLKCVAQLNEWSQRRASAIRFVAVEKDSLLMDESKELDNDQETQYDTPERPNGMTGFGVSDTQPTVAKQAYSDADIDPIRHSTAPSTRIAHLLCRPLVIYMESLAAQNRAPAIINTVRDLQASGYLIDTRTWNKYVRLLIQTGDPQHIIAAFRASEVHLAHNMLPYLSRAGDLKRRKAMLVRQFRAQSANHQHYLHSDTLRQMKEVYDASTEIHVPATSAGLESSSPVSLPSVLDLIAPVTTSAVKSWTIIRTTQYNLTSNHDKIAVEDTKTRRHAEMLANTPDDELYELYKSDSMNGVTTRSIYERDDRDAESGTSWRWPDEPSSDATNKLLDQTNNFSAEANHSSPKQRSTLNLPDPPNDNAELHRPMNAGEMVQRLASLLKNKRFLESSTYEAPETTQTIDQDPRFAAIESVLAAAGSGTTTQKPNSTAKPESPLVTEEIVPSPRSKASEAAVQPVFKKKKKRKSDKKEKKEKNDTVFGELESAPLPGLEALEAAIEPVVKKKPGKQKRTPFTGN